MSVRRLSSVPFSTVTVALVAVAAGVLLVLTPDGWTTHARATTPAAAVSAPAQADRLEALDRYVSGLADRTSATAAALKTQPHDWARLVRAGRAGLAYLHAHALPVVEVSAVDEPLRAAVGHWRTAWTDHTAARLDKATVAATNAGAGELQAAVHAMAVLTGR